MGFCPNENDPVYQEMIKRFGPGKAYFIYTKNNNEIPETIEQAEALVEPEEVLKTNKVDRLKDIREKVLQSLLIQKAIYEKRAGGKKYADEISDLIESLRSDAGEAGIIQTIKIANYYTAQARPRMINIQKKLSEGLSGLTESEVQDLAGEMNEIKEFLSAFNVLEDIEGIISRNAGIFPTLQNTLERRRSIVRMFKEAHQEILAHWLSKAADRVNAQLQEKGQTDYVITVNQIKNLLHTATSDIDVWEKLFGAQANSKDILTGLIAASIKYEAFQAEQEDRATLEKVLGEYNKKQGDKNNPDKFNAEYLRDAEEYRFIPELNAKGEPIINEDGTRKGKWGYVKTKALHTEYLDDKFDKDYRDFTSNLPSQLSGQELAKKKAEWFAANTVLTDTEKLIAKKKAELSPTEYDRWFYSNTKRVNLRTYPDGSTNAQFLPQDRIHSIGKDKIVMFSGEFLKPVEKYKNPKFTALMKDNYFKALHDTYIAANEKLHPAKQLRFGIIPQIEKDFYDKYLTGNNITTSSFKKDVHDSMNVTVFDRDYGIQTPSGRAVKHVPIMFTSYRLDNERLSLDLLQSTLAFSQMANNYDRMTKVEPYISLLTDVIEGNKDFNINPRQVLETNASGIPLLNAITKTVMVKKGAASNVNVALMEFIDKVFYNEQEIQSTILGNVSVNKLSGMVLKYSALNSLAINVVSGVNNVLIGQYSNLVESVGKRYGTVANMAKASGIYGTNVVDILGDVGRGIPRSKVGKLSVKYDAIQGEWKDSYGKNVSGSAAKKLFNSNALFFLNKSGEHYIQTTGMINMMLSTKVKKSDGTEISLWDAYDENGELKSGVKWTRDDQFNFMQRLHKMNKELHGIYNKFDSPTLQRTWYGKLALLFRKYMYTGFMRRYSSRYLDIEGGDVYEGYWNTFFSKLYTDIKEGKWDMLTGKNLSEAEKSARAKTYVDLVAFASTLLLVYALTPDDDDDESWLTSHIILQSRRLQQDISWYVNPMDFKRLIETPSVAISNFENILKFTGQLFNPMEQYERKAGIYEKGDYKLEKRAMDLVPVLSRYEDLMNPEQLLNVFN
jgi:hypothetical protein